MFFLFFFSCYFLDVKYIFNKSTFCCRITTIVVVRIDSRIDGSRADAAFSYFALGRLSEHRIVFTDKTVSLTHILAMYTLTHMPTIYCWRREFFFSCCCCFLQLKISFFFCVCRWYGVIWFILAKWSLMMSDWAAFFNFCCPFYRWLAYTMINKLADRTCVHICTHLTDSTNGTGYFSIGSLPFALIDR